MNSSTYFWSFHCFSVTYSPVLCSRITDTLASPIFNLSLRVRECLGICFKSPFLHYRLEIAFGQECGTIRRLTSSVSLLSGTFISCCLFPMFEDCHLIIFVLFFTVEDRKVNPYSIMARSRSPIQVILSVFFI